MTFEGKKLNENIYFNNNMRTKPKIYIFAQAQ